jgi:hypothetical protein
MNEDLHHILITHLEKVLTRWILSSYNSGDIRRFASTLAKSWGFFQIAMKKLISIFDLSVSLAWFMMKSLVHSLNAQFEDIQTFARYYSGMFVHQLIYTDKYPGVQALQSILALSYTPLGRGPVSQQLRPLLEVVFGSHSKEQGIVPQIQA